MGGCFGAAGNRTYVAHDIASGHEATGVAGEEDGQSVELVGLAEAVHGCHVCPLSWTREGVSNSCVQDVCGREGGSPEKCITKAKYKPSLGIGELTISEGCVFDKSIASFHQHTFA